MVYLFSPALNINTMTYEVQTYGSFYWTALPRKICQLVLLSNTLGMQDHDERRIWDVTGRVIHACFNGGVDCGGRY